MMIARVIGQMCSLNQQSILQIDWKDFLTRKMECREVLKGYPEEFGC